MNDISEERLAQLLNESVDAQLGARRPAPRFEPLAGEAVDPRDELAARRRRRVAFLAVAATVIAVLVAVLGAALVASHDGSKRAPTLHHHHREPAPKLKSVRLGGATLALPQGWVARSLKQYGQDSAYPSWCLTPASTPVRTTSPFDCPIEFGAFVPTGTAVTLDPDHQGGTHGEPPQALQCFPTGDYRVTEQVGRNGFGGREAEFRQFIVTCPTRPTESYVEQQYVVASPRGYILNAYRTTSAIRAALRDILTRSSLPKAVPGGVRLADRGYVRSVRTTSTGLVIRIQRAITEAEVQQRPVRTEGSATYRYVVPKRAYRDNGRPAKGDLVYLASNGRTVIVLSTER